MRHVNIISLCLLLLCFTAHAAADRIEIEGLVTADPMPEGFTVSRQDVREGEQVTGHYILLAREGAPTRALVQIERREIADRGARVATLKAYVNATAGSLQKGGWTVKVRALPNLEEIDFAKPVAIDLDGTKADEKPIEVHLEVFFDRFAYQVLTLSDDRAQMKEMVRWSRTVRPIGQAATTQPGR